jgi:DNA polymerase-1
VGWWRAAGSGDGGPDGGSDDGGSGGSGSGGGGSGSGEAGASGAGWGSSRAAARARGRFTRNFVIQATAAEWALTLLATLRSALHGSAAQLVFFQHDEVMVHCPADLTEDVARAVTAAGERARSMLFGDTPVRFPLDTSVVECYADAA